MLELSTGSKDTAEAGFAGNIDTFVCQHRHDPRRRQLRETRLIGDLQDPLSLLVSQGMRLWRANCSRATISLRETTGFPALQGTHIDTCHSTGWLQSRSIAMRLFDPLYASLAILQQDGKR